jgi:lysophospholipase L1-like esterase
MLLIIQPAVDVYAADGIKIQFYNGNTEETSNSIYLNFNIVNNGTTALDLSTVKMRYYFTNDGSQENNFACDYSSIGSSNVTGSFGTLAATNTDKYLEISFGSEAGTLAANSNVYVFGRIWKSDWSAFTQTNDYSFHTASKSFADSTTVTGYLNGTLACGSEPNQQAEDPTPEDPTPEDPSTLSKALYIGRFDTSDPAGPKFGWGTSTIKANFQGTGISVNLKSAGDNWFNVIIDGETKTPINVTSSTTSPITLVSGLENGSHTIELVKRTEAHVGEVQFKGFTVADGSLMDPPEASEKRIMFIGDSITCGYGNEGTDQNQHFTTKNENASLAYGALTAKLLGADPVTIAWSGKGILRNYGGDTTETMGDIYSRILPYNSSLLWDDSKWIPHVVVINLCTNDFSIGIPEREEFINAYASFADVIRSKFPDADIYCAVGPMLSGDNLTAAKDYINSIVTEKTASGDQKIHFIEFPVQLYENGFGEDWHPSLITHKLMADQLSAQIKADLGW